MTELGFGALTDVSVHLLPVVSIVADLLSVRANRHQALQLFDSREGFFQLADAVRQGALQFQDADAYLNARA